MGCCNIIVIIISIVGVVLVIVGAILGFKVLPDYVHDEINKNTELKKGTEQYERFEKLPFPLDFNVYVFEITNPVEALSGTAKPNLKQHGPFEYEKHLKKESIEIDTKTSSIKYNQRALFNLKKNKNDTKEITTLNVPLLAVIQMIEDIPLSFLHTMLNDGYKTAFGLSSDTLFVKIKVSDYTFGDGYKFCNPTVTAPNPAAKALCALVRIMATDNMEIEDRVISFSLLKNKHNTTGERFKVNSGLSKISSVGLITEWKNKETTEFWEMNSTCNKVRGTDSLIYPPHNDKDMVFPIYNTDICRSLELEYNKEMEYKEVPGYRSMLKKNTMTNTGANACYCIKKTRNLDGKLECLPDGFLDMHNCLGAPIVLSFPHFLWADKSYSETVTGLKEEEEKHTNYVEMEPNTGTPLIGRKRVQFNMILRKSNIIEATKNLKAAVFPILWVEEGTDLTNKLIDKLKEEYLNKASLIPIVTWTLIGVGIAMFVGFAGLFIYRRKK